MFNTSIGPPHEIGALAEWLNRGGDNYFICDTAGALGDPDGILQGHPRVFCPDVSAGLTRQAFGLLSEKVLANFKTALGKLQG